MGECHDCSAYGQGSTSIAIAFDEARGPLSWYESPCWGYWSNQGEVENGSLADAVF